MPEIIIERIKGLKNSSEIETIFWETSSRKIFNSEKEKSDFRYKYLDLYFEYFEDFIFVAKISETEEVVGYCLGAPDTDLEIFYNAQPHLKVFKDLFLQYPAHLHINFLSDFRGQGLGSKLLLAFEKNLASKKIPGLHIMTASQSRNVGFYRKMNFHLECERNWGQGRILFMGKNLLIS